MNAPRRRPQLSISARLSPWAHKTRQMTAPVLAALLSFIFVAVHPLADLAGEYAFLVYTSVVLFYFPKGRVSELVENNTIDFCGSVLGLAWASAVLAVAASCADSHGEDSDEARAALAGGLAMLSLIGGCLRSYAPRLNVACRAAMFYPIFVLTAQQKITKYSPRMFLEQFFVTLFAYAFATLCGVICLEHSSAPALGAHVLRSVRTTCDLLPLSLDSILATGLAPTPEPNTPTPTTNAPTSAVRSEKEAEEQQQGQRPSQQQTLARRLREEVKAMRSAHAAYSLDVVRARHHPTTLKPVIRIFDRLQRNALLGPTGHVPGERIRAALERAYATPLSPVASRSVSRHSTPRRRSSGLIDTRASSSVSLTAESETPIGRHGAHYPTHPSLDYSIRRSHEISATQLTRRLSQVATHSYRHGERNTSNPVHARAERARASLNVACTSLSSAIIAAFHGAAGKLAAACDWHWPIATEALVKGSLGGTHGLRERLDNALNDLQHRLSGIIDTDELHRSSFSATVSRGVTFEDEISTADWLDDEDRFRIAFYMIALLDLARDARHFLDVAEQMGSDERPKRWMLPRIRAPWAPWPSDVQLPSIDREVPTNANYDETERDRNIEDLDFVQALLRESREAPELADVKKARTFGKRLSLAWRSIWDRRAVVASRVFLSKILHALRHSRHVHFAMKQTIGISLLSLPAFMPAGNSGRHWYDSNLGAWMVVSFMYVLEVTSGATLRVGFYRMLGTFIGALLGFLCTIIAGTNPYGLVTLATACAVPISYGVLFTRVKPMAIVTGITLPPIVFFRYLGLGKGKSEFDLAWTRFVMIVIGIAAAVVIGLWLWPIHARVQYFSSVADTMDQITEYYLRMSRDLLRPSLVYQANRRQYSALEVSVRRKIARSRLLVDIQAGEISLLPRPIKLYVEAIDLTERLIATFAEIQTLRFSLPRKATVLDVLPIRRELVSALLVNLWACGQAFRSRSPLPQHLPSPRIPLGEVMDATDAHAHSVRSMRARENRRRQAEALGRAGTGFRSEREEEDDNAELAVLYGMAENEALGEAINAVDELAAAARTLFGTQSFLDLSGDM